LEGVLVPLIVRNTELVKVGEVGIGMDFADTAGLCFEAVDWRFLNSPMVLWNVWARRAQGSKCRTKADRLQNDLIREQQLKQGGCD
jgi:hypothetical protein